MFSGQQARPKLAQLRPTEGAQQKDEGQTESHGADGTLLRLLVTTVLCIIIPFQAVSAITNLRRDTDDYPALKTMTADGRPEREKGLEHERTKIGYSCRRRRHGG